MDLIKNDNKELLEYDEYGNVTHCKRNDGYEKWCE